jgi:adenosylhomocysteine nucleosidase
MKTIVVLCALEYEKNELEAALENALVNRHEKYELDKSIRYPTFDAMGGIAVFSQSERKIVIAHSGMGLVNAAAATQFLISQFDASVMIMSGIAGSLKDDVAVGDFVVGSDFHYLDTNSALIAESFPYKMHFTSDKYLLRDAKSVFSNKEEIKAKVHFGKMISGNKFVDQELKDGIVNAQENAQEQALCVDMETTASAHIAQKNRIPFIAFRVISDNSDEPYENFSGIGYSENIAKFTTHFLLHAKD